jgi:hypothetical protein
MFGVPTGKLQGFIIFECGIEANPKQISKIMGIEPVKNLKRAQRLTGCLGVLRCFISHLRE